MFFMTSLLGCNSSAVNSTHTVKADSFIIIGNKQSLKAHSKLSSGTLLLGDIKIKYWPLTELHCSPCDVTLDKVFHPNGPTTSIIAFDKRKRKTWITSSFQNEFSIGRWKIKHVENQAIITDFQSQKKTSINFKMESPISINSNKNCSLLWSKKEFLAQPNKHIAPDVSNFKSQLIIQCDT